MYLYVNHKNMRKLFNIDQEEKNRILEMHENATKKHYLNEYSGVAFGDEQNGLKIEKVETKEQTAPVQPNTREEIVKQAMNMFPDPQWYSSIAGKEISAADPNAIKAFNLARRFFDSNIPQLSLNQGADFFEYMKQKGNGNGMVPTNNNIALTKSVYDLLIPSLQKSRYPNSQKFDVASVEAGVENPKVSKLLSAPVIMNPAKTLYQELTKTA
jgi:hypothetical protein